MGTDASPDFFIFFIMAKSGLGPIQSENSIGGKVTFEGEKNQGVISTLLNKMCRYKKFFSSEIKFRPKDDGTPSVNSVLHSDFE